MPVTFAPYVYNVGDLVALSKQDIIYQISGEMYVELLKRDGNLDYKMVDYPFEFTKTILGEQFNSAFLIMLKAARYGEPYYVGLFDEAYYVFAQTSVSRPIRFHSSFVR